MTSKPRPPGQAQRGLKVGRLALIYAGLTVVLTYPVVRQLGTAVAGFDGRDSFQHVWYQWWMKETLLKLGVWPDRVTHLYYPMGAGHPVLALHPYVPFGSLPLTLLFGPVVSYNVAFLLSFILSGLTGYLLCRYLSRSGRAAALGGLIFAFYPNRFGHALAGHLLLTTNYFLPLYALSLLILLRRPSLKNAGWHAVVTAMLALAQPTHIGYGIMLVFPVLVGGYLANRPGANPGDSRSAFIWLIAANLLAMLIFLPFAWPLLGRARQAALTYLTPQNLTEHSTDLLAFIMPSPYNPLLAKGGLIPAFSASIVDGFRDLEEQLAYPGLAALALAGLAVWRRWQASRGWLLLSVGCALLSLGPFLKIGGQVHALALPYLWLGRLPFFAWSRAPGRLNETVMLGIAVMASIGAAWLSQRVPARQNWARGLFAAGLGGLILVEYPVIFPFPTEARPVSGYYRALAAETIDGGILELPVTGSRRASNYAMYYQTVHEHPLAGGYIERDPPGTVALKEFLNRLVSPLPSQTVLSGPDEAGRRNMLVDMNIRRVIAHPALMTDRAARTTLDYLPVLFGPTIFEDQEILVYPLSSGADGNLSAWQLLPGQENWEVVKEGTAFRLKKSGFLFIYAAGAGEVDLKFTVDGPAVSTRLSLLFNDSLRTIYSIDSVANYTDGPLPLHRGLNYLWLSTDPARNVEFLSIAIEPVTD